MSEMHHSTWGVSLWTWRKKLYLIITLLSYRRGIGWNSSIFFFFFRGLSLRCFWCCNFLVWFDHSEMQDEHVAIILYICMIQALSYSLIFYRNLENRHPQFTDTACIVECFCIILFTSLDFPIKCFHKRLQGSAFIWSYLILICMEIFCSLFVPLTHLTTQSLRPCQKTIHLKTEILSKKKK